MISEAEALAAILEKTGRGEAETLSLLEAVGRYAAAGVAASVSLPGFDNSAMDGFAVQSADSGPGRRLRIVGEQPAGLDLKLSVRSGEAVRIFTGAPIPSGADGVIMQEETRVDGDVVVLDCAVEPGEHIRRAGTEICRGQKIVAAGDLVTPGLAGLLASQGLGEVSVGRRPRVAILATGDELATAGATLMPGQIYESNGVMIAALAREVGVLPIPLGIARDEAGSLRRSLEKGLSEEVLIVTGGVSVGARDLVKDELRALGVEPALWRVAVKPGKPFLFGYRGGSLVFGLPGNPVSTFVTFSIFVRPALLKLMGARECAPEGLPVRLGETIHNPGDRPHYLRGRVERGVFSPAGMQVSHALAGLSRSNALLRVEAGRTLRAGEESEAILFRAPIH